MDKFVVPMTLEERNNLFFKETIPSNMQELAVSTISPLPSVKVKCKRPYTKMLQLDFSLITPIKKK